MSDVCLELTEQIAAPIARVFEAWSHPEQVKVWFGPGGCEVLDTDFNPVAGSPYFITLQVGEGVDTVRGTFQEVDAPNKLSFTWQWDGDDNNSLVTVGLKEDGDSTRLTLTHVGLANDASKEKHNMGWTGSLTELKSYL